MKKKVYDCIKRVVQQYSNTVSRKKRYSLQNNIGKDENMAWNLSNDRPIYAQVIERIEMQIISGFYQPGDKLPSVREFAAEAGVNPNTMQKALGELERMQLIVTQRTSGRVVTEDNSMIENAKNQFAREQIKTFLDKMNELGIGKEETIRLLQGVYEEEK